MEKPLFSNSFQSNMICADKELYSLKHVSHTSHLMDIVLLFPYTLDICGLWVFQRGHPEYAPPLALLSLVQRLSDTEHSRFEIEDNGCPLSQPCHAFAVHRIDYWEA